MPASSMCSMMPAISTFSPSERASTSTSMASSRKRSIEYRAVLREVNRLTHVAADRIFVIRDHHGAAAKNVAGPHQHRIADTPRHPRMLPPRWLRCR